MYRVFVFTGQEVGGSTLPWPLDLEGFESSAGAELQLERSQNGNLELKPDVVLLDLDSLSDSRCERLLARCRELKLPVIAVVSNQRLVNDAAPLDADDFIIHPFRSGELTTRLGHAIARSRGPQRVAIEERAVIKGDDLVIDPERYDVSLAGKRVLLTYKEFQLLVLLASNPGKVYTRDHLLSQVWGYDYFGGTRTVDVHIRRLRSKIEGAGHSFIETIRNVGYRFKATP